MKLTLIRQTLAAAVLLTGVSGVAHAALPFLEDDYARAVAQARSRNVPIFAEAWTPW